MSNVFRTAAILPCKALIWVFLGLITITSGVYAQSEVKPSKPKTRLYEYAGTGLYDGSIEITGRAQIDKYLEMVGISTTTITTPETGHMRVYLSSSSKELLLKFDDGSIVALGSAVGDISAVTAGLGLIGGGTSGDVTLYISTPIAEAHLPHTYASSVTFATTLTSSGTVTNFTALASTSNFVTTQVLNSNASNRITVFSTVAFSPSTLGIYGTHTNDDALPGIVGQYISSTTVGLHTFTTTNQYGDLVSISVPPGDWQFSALMVCDNVANFTATRLGISTTSGNSTVGLVQGDNLVYNAFTSNFQNSSSIPGYRVSVAATTTYYLKFLANYTGTAPTARGRLSATRVR